MALVLKDRVQETATANTTVSFTMAGAVTGFQSFSTIGNTNTTYYSATDGSGNWETGVGTYSTTGPTLTRTTILSSSNSGSAVTFSGTVNVFVTYPATKSVNLNESGYTQLDFTNATLTSRNSFQTSTANSTTGIYALPSGTSTAASWQAANNSDPTNASKVLIATNGTTDVQLVSGINGTGTYLPLTFFNGGVGRFVMGTSGQFGVGPTATVSYGTSGQVLSSGGASAAPTWASVVTSAVAGTGISVSGATGAVTITNAGVTSVNSATGAVTVSSIGASNSSQSWQAVTRALSTTYTNSTSLAIQIAAVMTNGNASTLTINGATASTQTGSGTAGGVFYAIVPSGHTYGIVSASNTIRSWYELR